MGKFPELTNKEIFDVLLCGGKPRGYGYTIQDYVDEWNDRVTKGEKFQVDVPPLESSDMDKKDLLVITSDGKLPQPCGAYDEETGRCKNSNKSCDTCYENSFKVFE